MVWQFDSAPAHEKREGDPKAIRHWSHSFFLGGGGEKNKETDLKITFGSAYHSVRGISLLPVAVTS